MKINYGKKFIKNLKKCPLEVRIKFRRRVAIFSVNKDFPLLHNHMLIGKMQGLRSINITGDVRALYEERENNEVIFVAIGTHSELYK